MSLPLAAGLAALLLGGPGSSQESGPCFRIFPVETPLQRHLLSLPADGGPACYVSVFGNGALGEDGEVRLDATLLAELLLETAEADDSAVLFSMEYGPPFPDRGGLQDALNAVAEEVGFATVRFQTTSRSEDGWWKKTFGDLPIVAAGEYGAEEPVFRGKAATTAPVHTKLSGLLLRDADLYMDVRQPVRAKEGYVSEELAKRFGEDLLPAMNTFGLVQENTSPPYRSVAVSVGTLVAEDGFMACMESVKGFAEEWGLSLGNFSVSLEEDPAADELIGKPAPNFTLESLDGTGERRSLRELANTRVALLTFWGIG